MEKRVLLWEGCNNVRDLGGLRTGDGRTTRWGAVIRSDSPARLTGPGFVHLVTSDWSVAACDRSERIRQKRKSVHRHTPICIFAGCMDIDNRVVRSELYFGVMGRLGLYIPDRDQLTP